MLSRLLLSALCARLLAVCPGAPQGLGSILPRAVIELIPQTCLEQWVGSCGFLHPEPATSRERVSPNLPRAVSGRDGSDIREIKAT